MGEIPLYTPLASLRVNPYEFESNPIYIILIYTLHLATLLYNGAGTTHTSSYTTLQRRRYCTTQECQSRHSSTSAMVRTCSLILIRLNPSTMPHQPQRPMKTPFVKLHPLPRFLVHRSWVSSRGAPAAGAYGSMRRMIRRVKISPRCTQHDSQNPPAPNQEVRILQHQTRILQHQNQNPPAPNHQTLTGTSNTPNPDPYRGTSPIRQCPHA